MIKNNILVNTETRKIKKKDYDFLGVSGENSIEQIVFKLSAFIDGEAILEIEKYNKDNKLETHYFELQKENESYVFEVKSSLLDVAKDVKMQLHITTENVEVFKSKKFTMKVYEAINATKTIPEQYEEWIDIANSKIAIINKLNENFTKLQQEVEQAETERNNKVDEAVNKITDLTEDYNENAKKKVEEYNDNTVKKEKDYNDLAEEKENELKSNLDTYTQTKKSEINNYNEVEKEELVEKARELENELDETQNNFKKSLKDYIDNTVADDIKKVEYNSDTATFTFTRRDDTVIIVDLPIESMVKNRLL